ncbi:MAG TPA: hypothetical protein VK779_10030 [Rhizomicrobium sp.]|jgi:hypothetical protein|nr:hypothetical protein [Rhizomicrobium sp.]
MFSIQSILTFGSIAAFGAVLATPASAADRELTSRIFMPTADEMTLNDVVADHSQADGPPRTVMTRTTWKSDMMVPAALASLVEIRHGKAMLFDYHPQKLPGADVAVGINGKGIHLVLSFPPDQ